MDNAADVLAYVSKSYHNDSIKTFSARCNAAATPFTADFRIEGVTNGKASGALFALNGTGAAPNGTITTAAGWLSVALTNAAVLLPGDEFAMVIRHSAGATPSSTFSIGSLQLTGFMGLYPSTLSDPGTGTWANNAAPWCWIIEMTTAGVVPYPGLLPVNAGALTNIVDGAEFALKFTAPVKALAVGMRVFMGNTPAAGTITFSLWDSTADGPDGQTALAKVAEDSDYPVNTTADGYVDVFFEPVDGQVGYELVAGTTYYAGVKATSQTFTIGTLTTLTVTNAMRGFPMGSNLAHLGNRTWTGTNPGAWTDTTATFPLISMIISQYDNGAGGAGGGGGAMSHRIP